MISAFDESSRPVATADFQYPEQPEPVPADLVEAVRVEAMRKIRAHLENEYRWAASARTKKARLVRFELINGTDVHEIAKRFLMTPHGVRKQNRALKLRRSLLVKGKK